MCCADYKCVFTGGAKTNSLLTAIDLIFVKQ